MSFWEPFNLMQLPLSAYTPGQGDPSMEGGWQTATGAPVYTFEMWQQGKAPYVTGATSQKDPSGALVYRKIGDQTVPVKITDYGPGVKGIDIASSNSEWATNFPYQGATDNFQPGNMQASAAAVPPPAGIGALVPPPAFDYNKFNNAAAISDAGSALGLALGKIGQGMQQQGSQGMQQALAMLSQPSAARNALAALANNPLMYLSPISI